MTACCPMCGIPARQVYPAALRAVGLTPAKWAAHPCGCYLTADQAERGRLTCIDPETAIYGPDHRRHGELVFAPVSRVPHIANGPLWALTATAEDAERMHRLSERRSQERVEAKAAREAGAA